ncbi:MAG: TIGR02466 family protein [Pseudomonadota bacterium]|nr:TIGR02466 family protein [Pseudomonadota bacterium]
MPVTEYEVRPLFAEPYFRTNIGAAITEKQVAFIKNLKMVPNQINLISENLYIFEEPALRSIKEAVQEALDVYAREVMGVPQKLYVTQSWSLVNPPGVGMHGHSHSNSLISGSLYYCDLPEPPSRMIFERHNSYQQLELSPAAEKNNLYNTMRNVVEPKKGELILFSSSLSHFVEPNQASEPRHSIAFNTFIRGKLGSYRDVSELVL